MAHTPGPWKWQRDQDREENLPKLVNDAGKEVLWLGCSEQYYPTEGTEPSNDDACLIAAAPELLAALEDARDALQAVFFDQKSKEAGLWQGQFIPRHIEKATAAIVKAGGKSKEQQQ